MSAPAPFGIQRMLVPLAVLAMLAGFDIAAPTASAAQEQSARSDAVTPVEEFSRQLDELKKNFAELGKRIEERAKTIDRETSVETSRKEIEELRSIVAALLGAVADNGEVSRLGAKALTHARDKLKRLKDETRYTPEQRQFLIQEWEKLAKETERATDELEAARTRFAQLLRTLQVNDDYVGELIEIRQSTEALKVIRQLAKEIKDASNMLQNFITALAPPKAGT